MTDYDFDYCYCHANDDDDEHDCMDYLECEECPYYYADEEE